MDRDLAHADLAATVGNTPMVELRRLGEGLPARIVAKLEMRNPVGSVKDRVALAMISGAEEDGVLKPGGTLVEPTGGNTGIGLAWVAASRGYRLILTMPENMSVERIAMLRQLGAEVVLTPGSQIGESVARAEEILRETPGAVMLNQFTNPRNPDSHRRGTAVEIWEQTQGEIDYFVAGVGTGGTITGVGDVLKQRRPGTRVIGVEPADSPVLTGGASGQHNIPGIGAGFVPDILNVAILDEVFDVAEADAYATARRLARTDGIVAGASSGAALHAALQVASRGEAAGKTICVLLADTGERYITTALFA